MTFFVAEAQQYYLSVKFKAFRHKLSQHGNLAGEAAFHIAAAQTKIFVRSFSDLQRIKGPSSVRCYCVNMAAHKQLPSSRIISRQFSYHITAFALYPVQLRFHTYVREIFTKIYRQLFFVLRFAGNGYHFFHQFPGKINIVHIYLPFHISRKLCGYV